MNGNCAPTQAPDAATAPDTTGEPRSYSWLPSAEASTPSAFMIATSGRPSAVEPTPGIALSDGSAPATSHGPGIQVSPSASVIVFGYSLRNWSTSAPSAGAVSRPSRPDSP